LPWIADRAHGLAELAVPDLADPCFLGVVDELIDGEPVSARLDYSMEDVFLDRWR
jgi:hypothetical protein